MCHFFSTSCGLTDLVVFISAFMGVDLSNETRRPVTGAAFDSAMPPLSQKVKLSRQSADGYQVT